MELDKRVLQSDTFSEMPASAKALYLLAILTADENGICQPLTLKKQYRLSNNDIMILKQLGYFKDIAIGTKVITEYTNSTFKKVDEDLLKYDFDKE